MLFDKKQRSFYLAGGLLFMLGTGLYVTSGVSGGSSLEMAIDKRVDDCWKKHKL